MTRYRSLLIGILVVVATFLVSCGGPKATAVPPTYTDAQITQIQRALPGVLTLRDRLNTLEFLIQDQNWTDISTYIHGPLGELRQKLSYLTHELLPADQKATSAAAKKLFGHLEAIDVAASEREYAVALQNYKAARRELDDLLQRVPQPSGAEARS